MILLLTVKLSGPVKVIQHVGLHRPDLLMISIKKDSQPKILSTLIAESQHFQELSVFLAVAIRPSETNSPVRVPAC